VHKDCAPQVWQAKPCQVWPQRRDKPGYAEVVWRGQIQYVHRVAFALTHGMMVEDLVSGEWICHHCDNPPCFEPLHLFLGTPSINVQDMFDKGRGGDHRPRTVHYGEAHSQAKLTDDQVLAIRAIYASASGKVGPRADGCPTYKETARRYAVTPTLIGMIVRRAIWKHI
jgi:hypothetical protein